MLNDSTENKDHLRLEDIQKDVKFINKLLFECGLESPFPFSRIVGDLSQVSDVYNLESAIKILVSLLVSKQV